MVWTDTLRWIIFVPVAWLLSHLSLLVTGQIGLFIEYLNKDRARAAIPTIIGIIGVVGYFFYGFVFVVVGGLLAPTHKLLVVVVLAAFYSLEAWRRCVRFAAITNWAYGNAVATIVGAITVVFTF